jgi:hypothetical protein
MIVTLRYFQNLSSKQIGELADLSPAAVDMRLSRARSQLRERLGDLVGNSIAAGPTTHRPAAAVTKRESTTNMDVGSMMFAAVEGGAA